MMLNGLGFRRWEPSTNRDLPTMTESGFGADLQKTIREVVRKQLVELREDRDQTFNEMAEAHDSLAHLWEPPYAMPDYGNKWLALLNVSRYQLGHARLAAEIFRHLFEQSRIMKQIEADPLHVIDLGSGALTAQIGLAHFMRKRRETGKNVPRIVFHNVDPSEAMKDIGNQIWKDIGWTEIADCCNHRDVVSIEMPKRSYCAVITMHAIYKDNCRDIEKAIEHISLNRKPLKTVVAVHKAKARLAREVMANCSMFPSELSIERPERQGSTILTDFRRKVKGTALKSIDTSKHDSAKLDRLDLLDGMVPDWREILAFLVRLEDECQEELEAQ